MVNIPRKDTTLDFGFVQIPVSVYPAVEDDELDLKTLCHGKPPKMAIRCAEGGEEYTSWNKIPERGYEWAKGQYIVLSPEEIAAAKESRPKVDSLKVDKSVDFQKTGTRYVYTNAMRVLPQEKSPESARGNYRAVYEVVKESGRAILARFSPSTKVRHYAIVADEDGVFIAYEIREKKPMPYAAGSAPADPKVKAQAKMLLESIHADDVGMEKEPDPLFELVQKKLEGQSLLPGMGQTLFVPQ